MFCITFVRMLFRSLFLSLCLAGNLVWAQEPSQDENEEQEAPQTEYEFPAPKKRTRFDWTGYSEIGYNHFLGAPNTLRGSVEGLGSIKINTNFFPRLRIGSALYVGMGLFGLAIREVRFEEPVRLFRTEDGALGYEIDSLPGSVRAKSKLQLGYYRFPIEVGVLHRKFHIAVFGYGEVLLWAKHKRKYREGSELSRFVEYGNRTFRTDPLQYGVGARLGYRGVGVFATYALSPLWKAGQGPEKVQPLQVGIYLFDAASGKGSASRRKARATAVRW